MSHLGKLLSRSLSVPGLAPLLLRVRTSNPLILMYHGIGGDEPPSGLNSLEAKHIPGAIFECQLRLLERTRRVISLSDMVDGLIEQRDRSGQFFPLEAHAPGLAEGIRGLTGADSLAFFDAIGRPELKTDPRFNSVAARFANVNEYFSIRNVELKKKTTAEWIEIFDKADVPAMQYHTLESLIQDPHLNDVGFFRKVDHPTEGRTIDLRPANEVSGGHRTDWLPAPHLGEHTREVLAEIGLDDSAIRAMIDDGSARTPG